MEEIIQQFQKYEPHDDCFDKEKITFVRLGPHLLSVTLSGKLVSFQHRGIFITHLNILKKKKSSMPFVA